MTEIGLKVFSEGEKKMSMRIQARNCGENQVIIATNDLQKLVEIARQVTPIDIETESDFSDEDLMRLAESSGAFDFLNDEREDIYSLEDLKVRYK